MRNLEWGVKGWEWEMKVLSVEFWVLSYCDSDCSLKRPFSHAAFRTQHSALLSVSPQPGHDKADDDCQDGN